MFGGGGFGASSNTFGTFGQNSLNKPATSTFPSTGMTGTSLFGATNTGGFGNAAPNTSVFGQPQTSTTSTSIFGGGFNQQKPATTSIFGSTSQPSTMFGQPNRLPGTGTGGLFSGSTNVSPFSASVAQTQPTGTSIQFNPITGNDTMMRNGVASPISTRNQCITCMKEYENKSLEELRLEDYQLGKKGPSQTNVFGGGQPASTGLFSSMNQSAPTSTFGQPTTAFGAAAPATGGLFSGLNQPKPTTSFFPNSSATTTSAFGQTTTPFSFNTQTSQPTSLFSSNPVSTPGGLGSSFGFGQTQATQPLSQQSNMGIFGAKPLTTQATAPTGFGGFNTPAQNTTLNKPPTLFGGTTAPFGTTTSQAPFGGTSTAGSIFSNTNQQQQQQQKPFSFGGFPTQQAQPTPFGSTNTFSFSNPTSSASTLNFSSTGGFGSTGAATSTTGFPSFGTNTTTNFGSITNTGFGNTSFSGLGQPSNTSSFFGNPINTLNTSSLQPSFSTTTNGSVPFGTTPYKDSPLFYNLITNRNLDEMTKPTNPIAQRQIREASRRKTSTSLNASTGGAIKNLTFPAPKNNSLLKDPFFDGFEEEDQGTTIDILSPKTSVKKLTLKNLRGFSRYSLNNSSGFNTSNGPDDFSRGSGDSRDGSRLNDSHNVSNISVVDVSDAEEPAPAPPQHESSILNESVSSQSPSDSFYIAVNNHVVNGNDSFNDTRNETVYEPPNSSYDGAQNHPCGVKSTRAGYYISPDIKELDLLTDAHGNCFVRGFIVGRHNFGEIRFLDVVNVANIDIDETVLFRHKEVVVYPDDNNKPPLGEGINVPAEIRLERVWPIDKVTKDPIKNPAKVKALKYEEKLRRSCARLNADFVSYDEQTGLWIFRVKHFSKYSCAPEEEDEDEGMVGIEATKGGIGLGGKTIQQLKLASGGTQALIMDDLPPPSEPAAASSTATTTTTTLFSPLQTKSASTLSDQRQTIFSSPLDGGIGEPYAGDYNYDLHPSSGASKSKVAGSGGAMPLLESAFEKDIDLLEEAYDEDKSAAEIPDYFGLMELNRPTGVSSTEQQGHQGLTMPPRSLLSKKLQHSKIPQHRKRDEIPFIDATKRQSHFYQLQLFPQSNYRRGSRVTFGPTGTFLRIINNSKDYPRLNRFCGQVKVDKLKPRREILNEDGDNSLYSTIITKQLSLIMNFSCPDNLFKLRPEGIVGELIKLFTEDVDLSKLEGKNRNVVKACQEELELWNLCNILWPSEDLTEAQLKDEGYLLEYRVRLGQWFKNNASMLFGNLYDPNDTTLRGLLMKGLHYEACELAVQQGNFILALNLAQCCGESKKAMMLQMEEWLNQDMTEFIPSDVFQIYRLCTGLPIWDDVDLRKMTTSEWLQHFAIFLWYICPLECSIDEAVMNYQALIQESCQQRTAEDEEDDDDISFPSQHDSSIANACIHLLKAYSCIGYPMKNILNPRANNPDCLDYKLSWFLLHNLTQFGYTSDLELVEDLTVGLAGQLESMGLFQWAIYVLKTLPETVPRTVMIDRILERNVSMENDRGSRLEFIVKFLSIPESHIKAHCFKR